MYQIMVQTKHNCTGDKYMRKQGSDSTEQMYNDEGEAKINNRGGINTCPKELY